MHWSRKKAYGLVVAVLLLPVLMLVVEHYRGKWALGRWKARQEARGEVFKISDLVPPAVPAGSNAYAEIMRLIPPLQAAAKLHELAPPAFRFAAPGKAILSVQLPDWDVTVQDKGATRATNITWALFADAVARHDAVVEALHTVLAESAVRSPLNYHAGFGMPVAHLPPLRSLSQHLCPAALVELQAGRLDAALDRIECLTALCRGMADERLVISQLVRMAIYSMVIGPTWQGLQLKGWNDPQLRRLQALHENQEFLSAMTRSVEMERAMLCQEFAQCRQSSSNLLASLGVGQNFAPFGGMFYDVGPEWLPEGLKEPFLRVAIVPLWQVAWSYGDELHQLKRLQTLIESARAVATNENAASFGELRNAIALTSDDPEVRGSLRYLLSSLSPGAFARAMTKALSLQTQRELMVAAIALKRFQQKHGQWPSALQELVPDFLVHVPRDYLDGQPLRYRLEQDGSYTLYSVGENGVDDGGDATHEDSFSRFFNWQSGKDLVWPRPASEEEIEAAHQ